MRRVGSKLELNSNINVLVYFVVGSLTLTTIVAGLMLCSTTVSADEEDSVVDDVSIAVDVSCTLSGTGMNSHVDSVANGTHKGEIGTTTLKAFCNDNEGFAIYAIGFTGDSYTDTNHTKLVGTNDASHLISTGIYDENNVPVNSTWGMKLAATTGTFTPIIVGSSADTEADSNTPDFSNYALVPDVFTGVAYRNSGTDIGITAEGSVLTATYDAYISVAQAADTYMGKVKYTLVHPSDEEPTTPQVTDAGKICYYPNGGNVVGSMGCQTISASDTSATLLASNFSREGYGFAGWSTTNDYSDSTGFYGPQEYITFDAGTYTGSNLGLSLYAHWVKSAGSLQSWTGCSSLASGAVTALTDQRDNETYAIAKLADGNCWMIENLRLDNTATGNSDGSLSQGYATGFIGLAGSEVPWNYNSTTANSLYSTDGSTTVTISGSNRMPRYNNVNTPISAANRPQNPTTNSETNSTTNAGMYSYGNYYTWAAVSTNISETSAGDYNTKSICPTGWNIPRGGNKSREATNDFWKYIVTGLNGGTNPANYGSSTSPYYTGTTEGTLASNILRSYPNNFVYSGYINGSSVLSRGSGDYYWSSTADDANLAYTLYFNSSIVNPGTYSLRKSNGGSVRCINSGV